jgi:hypothetical protein
MKAMWARNARSILASGVSTFHGDRDRRTKRFAHPGKDCEPDSLLVGKVPEHCALREAHPVSDRLRRDRVGAALAGQREDRGDDLPLPLVCGQAVARRSGSEGRHRHGAGKVA